MTVPPRSCRWSRRAAALLPLALLGPAAVGVPARPVAAQPAEAVAVATTLNAAWNARDVEAVVALCADDAQILQRDAEVTVAGLNVSARDVYGVPLHYVGDPPRATGRLVTWARGAPEIRVWAQRLLAAGHRMRADAYRATGDGATVTWAYAATADAFEDLGVAPATGTVEATVRGGKIAALTLASDPASVRAREAGYERAVATAVAHATAVAASGVRRRTPDTQGRSAPGGGPWLVAAGLSLVAVGVLAALNRPKAAP